MEPLLLAAKTGAQVSMQEHLYQSVHRPNRRRRLERFYKPVIHRTVSLAILLCIALGLVALIEYALRVLPHHDLTPGAKYGDAPQRRDLSSRPSHSPSATLRDFPTLDPTKKGTNAGLYFHQPVVKLDQHQFSAHSIHLHARDQNEGVNSTIRIGGQNSVNRQIEDGTVVTANTGGKGGQDNSKQPADGPVNDENATKTLGDAEWKPDGSSHHGFQDSGKAGSPVGQVSPGQKAASGETQGSSGGHSQNPNTRPGAVHGSDPVGDIQGGGRGSDGDAATTSNDVNDEIGQDSQGHAIAPDQNQEGGSAVNHNIHPGPSGPDSNTESTAVEEPHDAVGGYNKASIGKGDADKPHGQDNQDTNTNVAGRPGNAAMPNDVEEDGASHFSLSADGAIRVDSSDRPGFTDQEPEGKSGSGAGGIDPLGEAGSATRSAAPPYTTVINGHLVIITPAASQTIQSIKTLAGDHYKIIASLDGQDRLATYTIGALPTATPKPDSKSYEASQQAGPGGSQKWRHLTYEESKKPLMFIASPTNYFYSTYFPILLAVVFTMLLGYLYTATKMMEPFVMLSQNTGVEAKDFLWINYLSPNDTVEPFVALLSGRWLMLWVSAMYVMAQILSPLCSEVLGLYPSYNNIGNGDIKFGAAVWIHPQLARLVQAVLGLICIFIVGTWALLRRYPSHVFQDPSSIAGVAALANNPTTLKILGGIDWYTCRKDVLNQLQGTRWRLDWYQSQDYLDEEHYGIVPLEIPSGYSAPPWATGDTLAQHSKAPCKSDGDSTPPDQEHLAMDSTNLLRNTSYVSRLRTQCGLNILFLFILCAVFGIILAYQINNTGNSFDHFMNGDKFGPRFVLTIMCMLLKSQWSRLERREVVVAPFEAAASEKISQVLKRRHSWLGPLFSQVEQTDVHQVSNEGTLHQNHTVLAARTLIPATTLFKSLFRDLNMRTLMLSLVALLAEALVIVIPAVPYSAAQKHEAMAIARYFCLAALSVMLLTFALYWAIKALHWRQRVKMRREGNTVGAVLPYVVGTVLSSKLVKSRKFRYDSEVKPPQPLIANDKLGPLQFVIGRNSDDRLAQPRWTIDYRDGPSADAEL